MTKDKTEAELKKYIKHKAPGIFKNHLEFVLEYISNGGNATAAYMTTHPKVSYTSAMSMSSLVLKKFDFTDILLFMGVNQDSVKEAMAKLLDKNPSEYMKYYCKLHKLDEKTVKIDGEIKMPTINIVTQVEKE